MTPTEVFKPLSFVFSTALCSSVGHGTPEKVKVVHFIRHAEGHHNVAGRQDPLKGYFRNDLEDAHITLDGMKQCEQLRERAQHLLSKSSLVVVSPMNRTIQTASHSFPYLIDKVPWVAVELVRERTGLHPCDKRRPIAEHRVTYPHISFDHIRSDHDPLFSQYILREPEDKVEERARAFMAWLAERDEQEVIVVSHGNFLRILFSNVLNTVEEDYSESHGGAHIGHCEIRTYSLRT